LFAPADDRESSLCGARSRADEQIAQEYGNTWKKTSRRCRKN
jgi:hypothetical protein